MFHAHEAGNLRLYGDKIETGVGFYSRKLGVEAIRRWRLGLGLGLGLGPYVDADSSIRMKRNPNTNSNPSPNPNTNLSPISET